MYPTILTLLVAKTESYDRRTLHYSDIPTPLLSPVDNPPADQLQLIAEESPDSEGYANDDSVTLLPLHTGPSV